MSIDISNLNPGDKHYKAYVGPPKNYDLVGASQFNLLTLLGLRDHHKLLDIGCGSLRAGKLFIPYLLPNNYYGIEPNEWLIKDGIKNELGDSILSIKNPKFVINSEFDLKQFNKKFDFALAQSIFSHTSAKQIETCFKSIKDVLLPEGLFAATFAIGIKNYIGNEWVYPGCVTYTKSFIQDLANKNGLSITELHWPHKNNQTWILIYHSDFTRIKPLLNNLKKTVCAKNKNRYTKKTSHIQKLAKKFKRQIQKLLT